MSTDQHHPENEDLLPVSFVVGGLTVGGQTHVEGTWAYVPRELAEMPPHLQLREFGKQYFVQGITPGYPPAKESYLDPGWQERRRRDQVEAALPRAGAESTRSVPSSEISEVGEAPSIDDEITAGAGPVPGDAQPTAPPAPQPEEPSGLKTALANAGGDGGTLDDEAQGAKSVEFNFEEIGAGNVDQVRAALADAPDEVVRDYLAYERGNKNRVTLIEELEGSLSG